MRSAAENRKRIRWVDGWRGLAVLVMLGWHFRWDLGLLGVLPLESMFAQPAVGIRYFIVCSFVTVSGISARLSRNLYRRGWITAGCALVITAVTWLAGDPAWFGVLHLLGCCMLFYAAAGPALRKLPEIPALIGYLALFFLFHRICYGIRVKIPWLWMFGFRTEAFRSSDYYPLFPWMFLFLTGTVIGGRVREWAFDPPVPEPLVWVGRRALWIYMIHQPVLLGGIRLYTLWRT